MRPLDKVVLPFIPSDIMERYSTNMYFCTLKKVQPVAEYRGRCAICREVKVLWVELRFYWFEFPKNLLCAKCYQEMPEATKHERWIEGQYWRLKMYERRQARNVAGIMRLSP